MKDRLLLNYNRGETVAIGYVRPKTTAILFDKLWIPSKELFLTNQEILMGEKAGIEDEIADIIFQFRKIPREILAQDRVIFDSISAMDASEYRLYHNMYCDSAVIRHNPTGLIYLPDIHIIDFETTDLLEANLASMYNKGEPDEEMLALCELNSNINIALLARYIQKAYRVPVTPVFNTSNHTFSHKKEYIKCCEKATGINLTEESDCNRELLESKIIVSTISEFPYIIEEELEWQQILDLRKDKASVEKIRKLKTWILCNMTGKNQIEIKATLDMEIENYKSALKKHGIITSLGSLGVIAVAASTAIEATVGNISQVAACLSIGGGLIASMLPQVQEQMSLSKSPMSIIYSLEEKAKKNKKRDAQ